jgi:hypothetical protein
MINATDDELVKLQDYASLFLTPVEIALLLDWDAGVLLKMIKNKKTVISKTYNKGKLISKIELRRNTIKMAKHGSPQAEEYCDKYQRLQDNAEI